MYHDLIIHPSRIELVERVFSPGTSSFREKKLSSSDLDFKIDTAVIENGAHFESLRSSIKALLEPFEKDLSVLNIVIPSAYVQFKTLYSCPENTELADYINWEASKIVTDIPEHYRYGTYYDNSGENLIIAVIRKNISDFFLNVLKDIFDDKFEFRMGCRYSFSGNRTEFVHTDKTIKNISSFGTEIEAPPSSVKKSVFISGSFLIMILLLSVFYYFNPAQFKKTTGYWVDYLIEKIPYKLTIEKKIPVQGQTVEEVNVTETMPIPAEEAVDAAVSEEIHETAAVFDEQNIDTAGDTDGKTITEAESEPTTGDILVKTPEFWEFVKELSLLECDSVVFINRTELRIHAGNAEILSKAESIDAEKIYNCELEENRAVFSHESFDFPNSRLKSNYNKFVYTKDSFKIKPIRYYQNIFKIEPADKFYEFLDSLQVNGVEFKKFIISPKVDHVMFTVYFG
ncbi:MAG: hypothetical protein WC212_03330 [Candidatus Delongbacteria bacterium]